jgi:hypothetical protein
MKRLALAIRSLNTKLLMWSLGVSVLLIGMQVPLKADTFEVAFCGQFSNPQGGSFTWTCPTAAQANLPGATSEYLVYESDYALGTTSSVTAVATWTFTGPGLTYTSDTTTTTGGSFSISQVSSNHLTFNPLTDLPPVELAGFYDPASSIGTITVTVSDSFTQGGAVNATGYAEIVYDQSSAPAVPEPTSVGLFATVVAASALLMKRKRRAGFKT